jgi:hypothetical protein
VIVKPSLGLTQTSTPADRCPSAGPASKHAAAHLGVWNAEEVVARAIADRVNAVRASRTRAAARFNRLIVKRGQRLLFKPSLSVVCPLSAETRALLPAPERRTFGRSTLRDVSAAA